MQNSYTQDLTACGLLQEEAWNWIQVQIDDQVFDKETEFLNRLPARSEKTIKRYQAAIFRRYKLIDVEDLKYLATSFDDTFKQFNLLLTIQQTRILGDFITQVICGARRSYLTSLSRADIERFFEQTREKSEDISNLSESSFKKVKSNVLKIMTDAGLLEGRNSFFIQNFFLTFQVEALCEKYQLTPYAAILDCKT